MFLISTIRNFSIETFLNILIYGESLGLAESYFNILVFITFIIFISSIIYIIIITLITNDKYYLF